MIAKFVILALVCVSMTQADEEKPQLDKEIEAALYRLKGMTEGVKKAVEAGIKKVEIKKSSIQSKTSIMLEREARMEEQMKTNLERIAKQLEEKANESKNSNAILECIQKTKEETLNKIKPFGPKFKTDMNRLERTKLASMEGIAKPLETTRNSMDEKYESTVKEIKSCKDVVSVRKILSRVNRDFDLIYAEVRRVASQIGSTYSQFDRDATTMLSNVSRQVNRIESEGIRAMRNCVYGREVSEE